MNTNKLLMAAAAAALIVGTGGALAQQEHGGAAEKAAPKAPGGEIHQNAHPAATPKPAQGAGPAAQNRAGEPNRPAMRNAQGGERGGARSETTGQAPAQNEPHGRATEEKSGTQNRAVQEHGKDSRNTREGERAQPENRNVRQGERAQPENRNVRQGERAQPENRNVREGERTQPENRGGREEGRTTTGQGAAASRERLNVNLTPEHRTEIHDLIINKHVAPRVDHVDFNVSVGTVVPRSFHIVEVPATIYDIEPAWRGFDYFMVVDQLVIVDPRTLEIVAVIDI